MIRKDNSNASRTSARVPQSAAALVLAVGVTCSGIGCGTPANNADGSRTTDRAPIVQTDRAIQSEFLTYAEDVASNDKKRAARINGIIGQLNETDVPFLIRLTEHANLSGDMQIALMVAFEHVGRPAVPLLSQVMDNDPQGTSLATVVAIQSVARIGPRAEQAIASVERSYFKLRKEEKMHALFGHTFRHALSEVGPPAIPALIRIADDQMSNVLEGRELAGAYLSALAGSIAKMGPGAYPFLIDALTDQGQRQTVALFVLNAMTETQTFRTDDLLAQLVAAFAREDIDRNLVSSLLIVAGEDSVRRLTAGVEATDQNTKFWSIATLGELGAKAAAAAPSLRDELNQADTPNAVTRAWIAQTLGKIGPAGAIAVPELISSLMDADAQVRGMSAQTLGALGAPARTAAVELLRMANDPGETQQNRNVAILALKRLAASSTEVSASPNRRRVIFARVRRAHAWPTAICNPLEQSVPRSLERMNSEYLSQVCHATSRTS